MRRALVLILLLLLGGAIVNIAVAWGFAVSSMERVGSGSMREFEELQTRARTLGMEVADERGMTGGTVANLGARMRDLADTLFWEGDQATLGRYEAGLPFRYSVGAEMIWGRRPHVVMGMAIQPVRGPTRILPLKPLWPGFSINTLFYAAILWTIFMFPFVLRRRLRLRRSQCPACAYPIGTSPVCTECGKPLPAVTLRRSGGM